MTPDALRREAAALTAEIERRRRRGAFTAAEVYGEVPAALAFVESNGKRGVARCSRRAGKTTCVAGKLLLRVHVAPHPHAMYVGPTLKNARQIVWPVLKRLNAKYDLGGVPNEAEAFMRFPKLPGEPRIYLFGAKDASEIEPIRGHNAGLAVIDEVQAIRPMVLRTLVDDILEPALLDYDGQLVAAGTPGPIKAGYFWDIDQGQAAGGWAHFNWTMRDNVHLARLSGRPTDELLAEVRERHGWSEDNPTYRREYLGEWVDDPGALMLHYDRARNGCDWQREPVPGWQYIVCFDLGHDDADAIGVLGWQPHDPCVYLCDELVIPKQAITPFGNQLSGYYHARKPISLPGDLGGLGKKIGAELQTRWQLPVEPADKTRKAEHIMLLDDALVTGRFKAPPDSRFAQDCAIMQWDQDAKALGVLREDPAHHSDIIDAVLYGFRRSPAYLAQPAEVVPAFGTDEHAAAEARAMREARAEALRRRTEDPWGMFDE